MRPRLKRCPAYLHITGDDLQPEEISELLGCSSTSAEVKGDKTTIPDTGIEYVAKTGSWMLTAWNDKNSPSLDVQIKQILAQLTDDLSIWDDLRRRYEISIFCGLFMDDPNQSLAISAKTISELGKRGIDFEFDIYGPKL